MTKVLRSCIVCGHPRRPHHMRATERPGTRRAYDAERCDLCAKRAAAKVDEPVELLAPIFGTNRQAWTERAACRTSSDPDAWFRDAWPGRPPAQGYDRAGEAKAACAGCDVRAECLEYALVNDEKWGVWGGLTANERTALQRRRA